jgi:hypothetical protein
MRKLIESTFVTLGGDISAPQDWGPPYIFGPEQDAYGRDLLFGADALLLGRKTYEGLSAAYTAMAAGEPRPQCRLRYGDERHSEVRRLDHAD